MSDIIHFRTKKSGQKSGTGSTKTTKSRGTDYSTIRPAILGDDARDIAWKQYARSDTLSVKSREDSMDITLTLIGIEDTSWAFFFTENDKKNHFYTALKKSGASTIKLYGYGYSEKFFDSITLQGVSDNLSERMLQKNVILIVTSSLDLHEYANLGFALHNDVIILHLLHPYERDPSIRNTLLLESHTIDIAGYKKDLKNTLRDIEKTLAKQGIDFLSCDSTDKPVDILNNFFKYRYARK